MSRVGEVSEPVSERMDRLEQQYSPDEHRPLKGYATALAAYGAAVVGLGLVHRRSGRTLPERIPPYDLAVLTVATHRVARTLTKDAITSPIRAPFARYVEPSAPAELHEEVRDDATGWKHTFAELLMCPFCLAQWTATSFTAGYLFAPRATRVAAATMAAVAGADFLQYAYAAAQQHVEK